MNSQIRSFFRISIYFSWVLISLPIQAVSLALRLPFARRFPLIVHRVCTRITGHRVQVRGKQIKDGPVLFVSSHCSYIDISVLGSIIQASFVAKAEVASYPIFGWCARLSRCIFVDRRARFASKQAEEMIQRLRAGDSLILFPEGTSSDGNRVLPFRSALFKVAEFEIDGAPVTVQPVSLAYTRLDGIPLGRHLRPFFAWYGDMEMASHMWQMVGMGRLTAVLEFHPPVTIDQFGSRKELAAYCQAKVAAGVATALAGRPQEPAFLPKPRPAPERLPAPSVAELSS